MSFPRYERYKDSGVEWLDEVPKHWEVKRLKQIADVLLSNVDKHTVEGQRTVRLCNYIDVYKNDRITSEIDFMRATASDEQIERLSLRKGDVVITKDSEDPSDIGVPALVEEDIPELVCGYHLAIVRPITSVGCFLTYLFRSTFIRSVFEVQATGMTRYALGKYDIENLTLAIPQLREQFTIGTFLDRETAKIDALMAEQQRLIELLKEKRQAVISYAVTKGLNPDAPMKDSGIEWLGQVPEHWEVISIKWLSPVLRGASPRPIDDQKYFDDDGEYAWVRIADVSASDGILRETTQKLSDLGSSLSVKIEPGSIFVSIAGTVGKPCISAIKACIHDGFVYFPKLEINPQFLYRIFESGTCYAGLGKWGTQLNLNTDTIGSIRVALPPQEELNHVLTFLDRETAKIDALIAEAQMAITLLQERRTALISAAVTGKIDVRSLVADQADVEQAA